MRLYILFVFYFILFSGYAQSWMPKPSCAYSPFSVFKDDSGKFGVIDADSSITIPALYEDIYIQHYVNDSCGINDSIAILIGNDGHELVNLRSFKRLKPPGSVQIVQDYIFYKDSLTWGVYDLSFRPLIKNSPGAPMFLFSIFDEFRFIDFSSDWVSFYQTEKWSENSAWFMEYPNYVEPPQNIIAYEITDIEYSTTEKKYAKHLKGLKSNPLEYRSDFKEGLMDITNGEKTKAIYTFIAPTIWNGEIYYWCVRHLKKKYPNQFGPVSGYIDILNKELKNIKTIEFDDTPSELMLNSAMNQLSTNNPQKLIIVESNGKFGAYNSFGKQIIPNNKDSIVAVGNFYNVTEDERVTLYNSEGVQLLKGNYYQLNFGASNSAEIIVQIDSTLNSWCVANFDGNLKHLNCTIIYYSNYWGGDEQPKDKLKSLSPPVYRCIRDNHYYVTIDDEMIKVDSSNYVFNLPTTMIGQFLINKEGGILLNFNSLRLSHYNFYWGYRNGIGLIVKTDGTGLIEIENIHDIKISHSNKIIITFRDKSVKFFDYDKWEWIED
jgi:hypothetical protein